MKNITVQLWLTFRHHLNKTVDLQVIHGSGRLGGKNPETEPPTDHENDSLSNLTT